jgi:hypothetical protein
MKKKSTEQSWPASKIELWKAIPGLDYYEASSFGRVRSIDRVLEFAGRWGPTTRFHKGIVLRLKPKPNGWGGIYWSFAADGRRYFQVNRVVCLTFNGEPPTAKHEAAHLDGDTDNNRSENLMWATPVENASHKIVHGTVSFGERNGQACLDESKVRLIIESYCSGAAADDLADLYHVSRGAIIKVVGGITWGHVDVGNLRFAAKLRAKQNVVAARMANNAARHAAAESMRTI